VQEEVGHGRTHLSAGLRRRRVLPGQPVEEELVDIAESPVIELAGRVVPPPIEQDRDRPGHLLRIGCAPASWREALDDLVQERVPRGEVGVLVLVVEAQAHPAILTPRRERFGSSPAASESGVFAQPRRLGADELGVSLLTEFASARRVEDLSLVLRDLPPEVAAWFRSPASWTSRN
jgi:hypothetical protein